MNKSDADLSEKRGKLPLSSAICSLGDASFAEKTIRTRDRTSGKVMKRPHPIWIILTNTS